MQDADRIRESVAEGYTQAIRKVENKGCCTPNVGVAAQLAGYHAEDFENLPGKVAESSFGCGNPLAYSEVQPGQTVLDLGSGAGVDLLLAAQRVGPTGRVIGVDMTDAMIEAARKNIAASGHTNVEVRKGLIEELPVETGTVDWVISNCVINLSPEKDRVFREIARVLKPGGRMVVSDLMAKDLPQWVLENAALYSSCISGAISEDDYLAGLRSAGLVEVGVIDRLIYDDSILKGLATSELEQLSCCGSSAPIAENAGKIAAELSGKIWSAKVVARKAL